MGDQPIDIHYVLLEEWLRGREALITRKHAKEFKKLLEIAPKMVQVAKYDVPALKKSRQRQGALAEELRRRLDTGLSEVERLKKQQTALLESYGLIDIVRAAAPEHSTHEFIIQVVQEHFDAVLDVRLNCAFHALCLGIQKAAKEVVPTALAAFGTHVALVTQGVDSSIPQMSELFPVLSKLVELADANIEVEGPAEWKYVGSSGDVGADGDAPGLISWGKDDEGDAAPATDVGVDADGGIEINWGEDGGVVVDTTEDATGVGSGYAAYSQVLVDAGVVLTSIPQLLHKAELRGALLDEVDALLAFFNETIEPTSQGDQSSRDTLIPQTVVSSHRAVAKELHASFVSVLRDPRQQELLRLRSDLQSRVVFGEGVMRLSSYAHAIVSKRDDLISQSNAAAAAAIALAPQVDEAIKAAEGLQQQCETILCGIFTPRPVYLSGDINAL